MEPEEFIPVEWPKESKMSIKTEKVLAEYMRGQTGRFFFSDDPHRDLAKYIIEEIIPRQEFFTDERIDVLQREKSLQDALEAAHDKARSLESRLERLADERSKETTHLEERIDAAKRVLDGEDPRYI